MTTPSPTSAHTPETHNEDTSKCLNSNELSESEAERLSLIRYQLISCQSSIAAPTPINNLAINTMQDVVEATLAIVGEHNRAQIKGKDFSALFDGTTKSLNNPSEIEGLRSSAIALNNARVGFKHHGNQIRDETLRRHLDTTVTLVNELVKAGFGIELDEISLLLFIKDKQVRTLIDSADRVRSRNDLPEALFRFRLAFDLAIREYESRTTYDGYHSVFETKPLFYPGYFALKDIDGLEKLSEWIERVANIVKLQAFGVDLQRYAYFDSVAPVARYFASDSPTRKHVRFEEVTQQHYSDSYHFVVDSAIKLSANDYTLTPAFKGVPNRERLFNPNYQPDSKENE